MRVPNPDSIFYSCMSANPIEEGLEIPSATRHIEVTAEAAPRRARKKATPAEEAHRSNGTHHRRRRREARP